MSSLTIRQYQNLLDDIKCQLSRLKKEVPPLQAIVLCNEMQRHLNRVMADVTDAAMPYEDVEDSWKRTLYAKRDNW